MIVSITIDKWTEYQPRKDLKSLSWFRVNSDIFDGQTYFKIKNDGLIVLLFVLGLAAKDNKSSIELDLDFAQQKISIKKDSILSTLKKLESLQILHVSDQIRTDLYENVPNITIHNEHNKQDTTNNTKHDYSVVVDFWNSFEKLPKVLKLSKERNAKISARLKESSFDYKKAIPMILESEFLMGSTGWRADFDWFIANETNIIKILEGKYSNIKQKSSNPVDHAKEQMKRLAAYYDNQGGDHEQG